jgi:predicted transcriptional regulator
MKMVVLLAKEEISEETYSLIFNSPKHPIRRNILRMLVDGPLAFSEILDGLSIDSSSKSKGGRLRKFRYNTF